VYFKYTQKESNFLSFFILLKLVGQDFTIFSSLYTIKKTWYSYTFTNCCIYNHFHPDCKLIHFLAHARFFDKTKQPRKAVLNSKSMNTSCKSAINQDSVKLKLLDIAFIGLECVLCVPMRFMPHKMLLALY